jgi:hypothetical protein
MNAYKGQMMNNLPGNMLQYIINNHSDNVNVLIHTVLMGLIEIQNIIPGITFNVA